MSDDDVTAQHPDYSESADIWQMVTDAVAGEKQVKTSTTNYLPVPNASDKSPENQSRYGQYLIRAVFYGITGRTLQTMIGAAFRKQPELELSGSIQYAADDIDGGGISIYQQSQMALSNVLQAGRAGLFVDYPTTPIGVSVADKATGAFQATVKLYPALSITNWRTTKIAGKSVLSMVVLQEQHEEAGEYAIERVAQYRVLRLTAAGYTQEVQRKVGEGWTIVEGPFFAKDSAGNPWREIPFTFIGAVNNDPNIDRPPLQDIASLNVAHYRNSADYEESVFFVGQAQPWMAGLTVEWRDHLEAQKNIYFGSRAPILLPEGGSFGLAQAAANSMAFEAMSHKEELMQAMGARLLTPGGAVKTATEAQGDSEAEHSVLSLAVSNVSEAYNRALAWMALFNGDGDGLFTINQEFTRPTLDPNMLAQLLSAVNSGKIPDSDFWRTLRKAGLIDEEKDDEMLKEELASQPSNIDLGEPV